MRRRRVMARWILWAMVCWYSGTVAQAATYYLNPASGNDGNAGSQGSPWKTLDKVASSTGPGDIVNIRGGTYTPSQYAIGGTFFQWSQTEVRGSAGNPITIQAMPGETVIFDGQGHNYWIYLYTTVPNAYYLVIQNLTFRNYGGVAIASYGENGIDAHHYAVIGCTFQDFINNNSGALAPGKSHHYIYKNNRFLNIGGPQAGPYGPHAQHCIYVAEGSQYGVIDGNYLEGCSGYGIHGYGHGEPGLTTQNTIIRKNTIVNAREQAGLLIASTNYLNTYVYNNTFYQDQIPYPLVDNAMIDYFISFHLSTVLNNTVVKNNLGYGYAATAPVEAVDNTRFNGTLFIDYNMWSNLTGSAQLYNWSGIGYTLTQFRQTFSNANAEGPYEGHTLQANPLFTNIPNRDFTLQSASPAINAGTFPTTTVGSGSGTTVTVTDAGFFSDGFGLVAGDLIQVGANSPVQITAVNYGTNQLTVAQSITWSSGQGVALPYTGTRPDIGANESGGGVSLPAPTNLRLLSTTNP